MKKLIPLFLVACLSSLVSFFLFRQLQPQTQARSTKLLSEKSPVYQTQLTNHTATRAALDLDFTETVERVIDGVVHVKNISAYESGQAWWMKNLYGRELPDKIGTGSGVLVSPDGLIITNYHVIEDANRVEITTNDNKTYEAELIGSDAYTDIAVLKIKGDSQFEYLTFGDSDSASVGEWVLAVGNPFNLNSTVTAGIISAKSRDLNQQDSKNQFFIQTDAAVNVGNSGGALVNTEGQLVGINTAITSIGGGFVGYSFAVPSNIAKKVFDDILEYGNVQKGLLGVSGRALDSELAQRFEVKETEGFYIMKLEEGMGAEAAGLQEEDIIKRIDGTKINKFSDLTGYISSKRPGDRVEVSFIRNGELRKVSVILKKLKRTLFFDMEVKNLTPDEKKDNDLNYGVKIYASSNRLLSLYGISQDAIILEVNGEPINDIERLGNFNPNEIESILFLTPDGERVIFRN
ncbi:MAG: trypsin-like peptidase domain-containing protein [Flavobacteriaceae bacterium]